MSGGEVKHEDKTWLRGWWIQYHYDSLRADQSPELRREFIERLYYHSKIFPCEHCIKHFQKYIIEHDPKDSTSMFAYTWNFHNAVNVRLGKITMDWETYTKVYKVEGYKCAGCSDNNNQNLKSKENMAKVKRAFIFD